MRGAAVLVGLLAGCGFDVTSGTGATPTDASSDTSADGGLIDAPVIDAPPGAWLAGFAYRKQVLVTPGATGMLTDFPVGILLASDPDLAAHAAANAIVVTTADAMTRLDSEVVAFGPGGALELWTRVPSLSLAGTTTLYLYYGGTATATDPTGVWPATFKAVWHLGDSGVGGTDSTMRANHLGQPTAGFVPAAGVGAANRGRARVFDGNDDLLTIADPSDGSLDVGTASFSLSLWVRSTGSMSPYDTPFYKGGTTSSLPGYCLFLGNGPWAGKLHDGNSFIEPTFAAGASLDQWVHLVMTIDRSSSTARAFMNGAQTQSFTFSGLGTLSTSQPVMIGAGSNGARFRGGIDEVRLFDRALAPAWIAAEYANLATPSFVTLGAQQQL
jgi:hypothetical protein